LKEKAEAKTKKVLNIDPSDDDEVEETPREAALKEINESPAFNSSQQELQITFRDRYGFLFVNFLAVFFVAARLIADLG
jgi:hypothetical protein